MLLDATDLDYAALNEEIKHCGEKVQICNCLGQRFIGAGLSGKDITVSGIPGNALGAYLNGAEITVHGNAQDAVGDTMNAGKIVIHGNIGDAAGYAMRGGEIFVQGNAGYRAGIHMKEYGEKIPALVIGGCAGSFLGEYQAGGIIMVLGLNRGEKQIVHNFPCTGMHGGKLILRGECAD
ncbi:MAG: glutamate synthase, partial [Oscillospiraceae bacterium]|nr:glutamate synthase [Oscillospiraceae bacterium]